MTEEIRSAFASEVDSILAGLCMMARSDGFEAAERQARAHLSASVAFLEETAGNERTLQILTATIGAIKPERPGPH